MKKIREILSFLCVFLIPFYFFRFSFFGLKTNIFEIFVLLLLIVSLPFNLSRKKFNINNEILCWFLPVFLLAITLISIIPADDKLKALGILKGWFLVPIIFAWLLSKNFNKRSFSKISIPIFISLLIISAWAILQKTGVISTLFYQVGDTSFNEYIKEGRAFGSFESPNYLAMFLIPAIFLALPVVELLKTKFVKTVALTSFVLPIFALYLSSSRAGFISLIVCLLVFLNYRFVNLQKSQDRKPFYVGLFIFLFIAINAGYLFFAANFYNPSSDGDKIRVEIYKYSGVLIKSNIFSGIGLGNFQDRISDVSKSNLAFQQFGLPYAINPHNLLLALWLNLGILGLITFIIILTCLLKKLFSSNSAFKAYLVAAIAAILIQGLFDTTYFKNDLSAVFWLIYSGAIILGNSDETI